MKTVKRNHMGKRAAAFCITLAMLASCLPLGAMAAGGLRELRGFEPLAEETARQTVPLGTPLEELALPETLTAWAAAPAEDGSGEPDAEPGQPPEDGGTEALSLGVEWEASPAYDPDAAGSYRFTAVLPQGYALAAEAVPPEITVTVEEGGALTLTRIVDDMEITLTARAGVFPADAGLRVEKITDGPKIEEIEAAIQAALDASAPGGEDARPALLETATFDIRVTGTDAGGGETALQPELPEGTEADGTVTVSFRSLASTETDGGRAAEVYRVEGEPPAAEFIPSEARSEDGAVVIATDRLALYTLARVGAANAALAAAAAETTALDFTKSANAWTYGKAFGGAGAITDALNEAGWAWYGTAYGGYSAKTLVLDGLDFATTNANGIILPPNSTVVLADGSDNRVASKSIAIRVAGDLGGSLTFKGDTGKLYAEAGGTGIYVYTTTGGSSSVINFNGGHITAIATNDNGQGVYASKNIANTSIYATINITGGTLYASGGLRGGWSSDAGEYGGAVVAGSGGSSITLGGNMQAIGSTERNASIFSLDKAAVFKHYAGGNTGDIHNNASCFKVTDGTASMTSPNADTVYVYQVQGFTMDFTAAKGAWAYGKAFGGAGANTDALNEAGWAWYGAGGDGYEANTLVMDGLFFETGTSMGMKLPANATVVVKGENRVASQYASNTSHTQGIYGGSSTGESNVTFLGDGKLYVQSGQGRAGYNTTGLDIAGMLTLKDGVAITAESGKTYASSEDSYTYGVRCKGLVMQDSAALTAKSQDSGYVSTAVMISGKGGEISGGTLTATAGNATYASATTSGSYGIRIYTAGDLTITGGTVTATAGNAAGVGNGATGIENRASSHGISQGVGNLTITGGEVTATAGDITGTQSPTLDGYSIGIMANASGKTAVIGGDAVVKATSGKVTNKDGVSYGLYMTAMRIEDTARVEIAAASGKQVMGLRGNSLTISGNPTVTVRSEGTSGNYTRGINLANNLTVSGGALNVTATGNNASSDSTGIHVGNGVDTDAIKISGGRVTVNCNGGSGGGKGIFAYYKTQMSITGGTIYATGNTTAISAKNTVSGSTAQITLNAMTPKGSTAYGTAESSLTSAAPLYGGTQFLVNSSSEAKTVKITPATQTFTLDFTAASGAWNYGVSFGGTSVNSASADKGWAWYGAGGGSYDAKTLVLDGLDFTTTKDVAVKVPDGTTVVLKNSNRACSTFNAAGDTYGFYCVGDLTIKGGGSLEVQGGTSLGYDYCSMGLLVWKTLTIADTANVTAKCAASYNARGVQCGRMSSDATGYLGRLVVEHGAELTADASTYTNYGSYLYGVIIYAKSANVEASVISGTVTAKSGNAPADKMSVSYGFFTYGDLVIDGGRVTATSGNTVCTTASCGSTGIGASGNLEVKGDSVVTATGGDIANSPYDETGYGIYSGGTMTFSDSAKVTAKSNTNATTGGHGIRSNTAAITIKLNENGWIDCTGSTAAITIGGSSSAIAADGMVLKGSTAYNAAEGALADASLRLPDKRTLVTGTAGSGTVVKTARIIGTGSPDEGGVKLYQAGYGSDDALILETTAISYYKRLPSNPYGSAYGGYYRTAATGGSWAPILFSNQETAVQIVGVKADGSTVSNPESNKGAKTMEYGGQTYYYSTDENPTPTGGAAPGPEDGAYMGVRADSTAAAEYLLTRIEQFDISYDANGGEGAALPAGNVKLAGLPFAIPAVAGLTREGSPLTGWNTAADGTGTAYELGGVVTEDGAVTLYAQYDDGRVTVALDQNGGTSGTESVLAVPGETMPGLGALPLKTNCTFAGYYDENGVQYYDNNGVPTRAYPAEGGPRSLKAKWADGLGIFAGRYSQYQVFDCHRTPAYPTANQPFRVFQFANPFTDSGKVYAENAKKATIGQMSNEQINGKIFYFKESGNAQNPFVLWFADDADCTNPVQVSKPGKIYSLGREGFLFVSSAGNDYGYFISLNQAFNKEDGDVTYRPTNPGPITKDEAENTPADPNPWTPNGSYTVTFDSNGATVVATPSKISVRRPESGDATLGSLPANPARTGYTFGGWYTAASGGDKFDPDTTHIHENMTVYARWIEEDNTTVSISLYKDDAVWTMQTVTVRAVDGSGSPTGSAIPAAYASRTRTYTTAAGAVSAAGTYAVLVGGRDTGARFTHQAGKGDTVEVRLYSVSYRAGSGAGSVPAASVELLGDDYDVLFSPAPAKSGDTFMGWTDRPSGQQAAAGDGYRLYESGGAAKLKIGGATTLTAVFKPSAPTVGDSGKDFTAAQPDTVGGKGSVALNTGHGGPEDYEYSADGGTTWTPWPDGGVLEAEQGAEIQIRKPAKGGDLASDPVTVTVATIQSLKGLVTAGDYVGVYDGAAHGINIVKSGGAVDAKVTFYEDDGYRTVIPEPKVKDATVAEGELTPRTVYFTVEKAGYETLKSSAEISISRAVLTAAYAGEVITYGDEPQLRVDVTGFVAGETAGTAAGYAAPTIPYTPGEFGSGISKSDTLTPAGGAARNYSFTYTSGVLVVQAASMGDGVTAKGYAGTYDGKAHSITVELTGSAAGGKITYKAPQGGEYGEENPAFTDAGAYTVYYKVVKEGYRDVTSSAQVVINRKTLSVESAAVEDKTYDGSAAATGSIALSGVVEGEAVAARGDIAFTSKDVGTDKKVDVTGVTLEGDQAKNYMMDSVTKYGVETTAKITAKEVALTWENAGERIYDGNPSDVRATAAELAAGDVCQVTVTGGNEVNAGTYTATAALSNPNYSIKDDANTRSYTIKQAMLTATYGGATVIYKDTVPESAKTVDVVGFVNGETAGTAAGYKAPTVTLPDLTPQGSTPAVENVTPTGGEATNYKFNYVAGTFTVLSREFNVVLVKDYEGDYDGQAHTLTVVNKDAAVSEKGIKVEYSTDGGGWTTTVPELTEAGTLEVQFRVSADGFNAQEGTATIKINPKKVTATMSGGGNPIKAYNGSTDASGQVTLGLTGVLEADKGSVTLTAGAVDFADKNVGTNKSVTASGLELSVGSAGNYVLTDTTVSGGAELKAGITPLKAELEWTGAAERTYDGQSSNVTADVGNLILGDSCTVTVSGGRERDAGTHTAMATALSNENYVLPDVSTESYTINKAKLTAKFRDETVVFGNKPALIIAVSGFVPGEDAASAAGYKAPTVSTSPIPTDVREEPYPIALTGGEAKNYSFDLEGGALTITAADMESSVESEGYTGVYDGGAHGITVNAPGGAVVKYYSDKGCTQELTGGAEKVTNVTEKTTIYYKVSMPNFKDVTGSEDVVITPRKVTPSLAAGTVEDRAYDGSASTTGGVLALAGVVSGETVTASGTIVFTDSAAGRNKLANITGIELTNDTAGNYVLSTEELPNVPTGAEITPKEAELAWSGYDNLVYTGEPKAVAAAVKNLERGDVCAVTVSGGTEKNAGPHTATATGLSNPNYKLPAEAARVYTIQKATLTATYKGETIGASTVPELTVEVTGFVEGESAADAAGYRAPAVAGPVPTDKGSHTLTPSGGAADNYDFDYVSGALKIVDNPIPGGITATGYEGLYDHKMHEGVIWGVEPQEGDAVQYSTDGGETWTDKVPQVGPVGDTDIQIKVTRPGYEELVLNVTASVKSAPIVRLDKPDFDPADLHQVVLGGSVEPGGYPVASQRFEYRMAGGTEWTALEDGQPDGDRTVYRQTVAGLKPDTEYEVRLTATDDQGNSASESLRFKTQPQKPPSGVIEGSVEDPDDTADITVTIELGNVIVASKGGLKTGGHFRFENLEDGEYNLVATDGTYKVTQMVTVANGGTADLGVVYVGRTQSVVKVAEGAPPVAVDGLKELFGTPLYTKNTEAVDAVKGGGTVELRLTAAEAEEETEIGAIREEAAGKAEGLLVDLSVSMIVTPLNELSKEEPVKETERLLVIAIPLPGEAQGRSGYQMFRYHDGQVDELKPIDSGDTPTEESFCVSGRYAYVYAQKFSTYAIYYDWPASGSQNKKPTPYMTGADQWLDVQEHGAYIIGRSDGLVHPEAEITRAEVAMIFCRLLRDDVRTRYAASSNGFTDVAASAWYNEAVSTLAGAGIVMGRPDGAFGPDLPITRAEFAAIASRFGSRPYEGEDLFTDIAGHWARDSINRAASYGWVNGVGDGAFDPDRTITRAEAVTIINRALGRLPESAEALLPGMKTWPDNADPDAWFYLAIQEATNSHGYSRRKDGLHEAWTELAGGR